MKKLLIFLQSFGKTVSQVASKIPGLSRVLQIVSIGLTLAEIYDYFSSSSKQDGESAAIIPPPLIVPLITANGTIRANNRNLLLASMLIAQVKKRGASADVAITALALKWFIDHPNFSAIKTKMTDETYLPTIKKVHGALGGKIEDVDALFKELGDETTESGKDIKEHQIPVSGVYYIYADMLRELSRQTDITSVINNINSWLSDLAEMTDRNTLIKYLVSTGFSRDLMNQAVFNPLRARGPIPSPFSGMISVMGNAQVSELRNAQTLLQLAYACEVDECAFPALHAYSINKITQLKNNED